MHGNNVQRELGTDSLKDRVDGRDVAVEVYSRGQGRSTRAALPPSIGQSKAPTTPNPAQNHQKHQIQPQPEEITRPDPRCQVTCLFSSIAGPVGGANLLVKSDKSPVALLAFEEEEKRLQASKPKDERSSRPPADDEWSGLDRFKGTFSNLAVEKLSRAYILYG